MHTQRNLRGALSASARASGFTLVELMVGLTIFLLVIASVVQLVSEGFKVYERSRDAIRITQTMQYQMENLRGMEVADIAKLVGKTEIRVDANAIPLADQSGRAKTPFNWKKFSMVQVITREQTDFYKAEITISWTDRHGKDRDETFATWFCEGGLNNYFLRTE